MFNLCIFYVLKEKSMRAFTYFINCYKYKLICDKFNIFGYFIYKNISCLTSIRLKLVVPVKKFSQKTLRGIIVKYLGYLEFLSGQSSFLTFSASFEGGVVAQKYLSLLVTLRNGRLFCFLMLICYLKFSFFGQEAFRFRSNHFFFYCSLRKKFVKRYHNFIGNSFMFLTNTFLSAHFTNIYFLNLFGFY